MSSTGAMAAAGRALVPTAALLFSSPVRLGAAAAGEAGPAVTRPAEARPVVAGLEVAWDDPRSLPTVVPAWRRAMAVDRWVLADGVVYASGPGGVSAVDARSGALLWSTPLPAGDDGAPAWSRQGPVVLPSTVAVSRSATVHLLGRRDGRRRGAVEIGGPVEKLVGPPLVAWTPHGWSEAELLGVDDGAGRVVARTTGPFQHLGVSGGFVVVITSEPHRPSELRGLDPVTLRELWRRDLGSEGGFVFAAPERPGLHVRQDPFGGPPRLLPFDARTGTPGVPLPSPPDPNPGATSQVMPLDQWTSWDLQADLAGSEPRLRRIEARDGHVVWSRTLPCTPVDWAHDDEELWVACAGRARGFLVTLGWRDGALRRAAYGLDVPEASGGFHVEALDGRLLLASASEIVALCAREVGPPERATRAVGQEVDRILTRVAVDDDSPGLRTHRAEAELSTLGPEVLPVLVARLPTLTGDALAVAAALLADHRPAAGALAATLLPGRGDPRLDPRLVLRQEAAVLDALGGVGGDAEVPIVRAVLRDERRDPYLRERAFQALARIGTELATAALDEVLAPPPPASWWSPPSPPGGDGPASEPPAGDHARLDHADGSALVVFRSRWLGERDDLWLAETDAAGHPLRPATFLGIQAARGPITLRWEDGALVVESRGSGAAPATWRVDPVILGGDADGDSLTDLVEARLGTDPRRADTDADGVPDALDGAPLAAPRLPASEEEELADAVFRQESWLRDSAWPLFVVSDWNREWVGHARPVFTVRPDDARLASRPWLRILPIAESRLEPTPDLRPDEREVEVRVSGMGSRVVMRRIRGRWYKVSHLPGWIY